MTQPIDLDVLQAAAEVRNLAGAQLANVAFNWSQQMGYVLTSDDCMMLDKLRREWDSGTNAVPALIARLRNAAEALKLVKAHLPEPECAIWRHVHHKMDEALASADSVEGAKG